MLIIRAAEERDVTHLVALAQKAGKGMTSLPTCPESLHLKVSQSIDSFKRQHADEKDYFLLVMEDTEKRAVVGTAGIYARIGSRQAFYTYRLMPVTHYSHTLNKQVRSQLLHLTNDYTGCSEVGTLFLDPQYRGNGRWLSKSRYLLMSQFGERFSNNVIAQLRGHIDEQGKSPFWEALGKHFFEMDYEEADRLCGIGSNQFITELMPKHPIYSRLLPKAARDSIGAPHHDSKRAMRMLLDEGYEYENVVDIFDGGPVFRAKLNQLNSVRLSRTAIAKEGESHTSNKKMLVANRNLHKFRVIQTPVVLNGDIVQMPPEALEALNIVSGDEVRFLNQTQEASNR